MNDLSCLFGPPSPLRWAAGVACSTLVLIGCSHARNRADYPWVFARTSVQELSRIPTGVSAMILADSNALRKFEAFLNGRAATGVRADTGTVIWWLAETRDPRYLPIFLRYSSLGGRGGPEAYLSAVTGLAVHADVPAAHARLLALTSDTSPPEHRRRAVEVLLGVNEPQTRAILAEIGAEFAGDGLREHARRVLAAPAARKGLGRESCFMGEVYGPDDTGAYTCHVPMPHLPGSTQRSGLSDHLRKMLSRGEFSPSMATDQDRRSVLHDSAAADALATMLLRRRFPEPAWRRESVLWWLAETKDPRFAGLFASIAEKPRNVGNLSEFMVAVYGLLKLRDESELARTRLDKLTREGDRHTLIAAVASMVNDSSAREVLRAIPIDRVTGEEYREKIRLILASPPLAPGEGRWPCQRGTEFSRGTDGRFRCRVIAPEPDG